MVSGFQTQCHIQSVTLKAQTEVIPLGLVPKVFRLTNVWLNHAGWCVERVKGRESPRTSADDIS